MRTKLLILAIMVFCSCGNRKSDDSDNASNVLQINLLSEPGPSVQKLSELAENVEYIPLQTTESSLMGNIRRKIVNINKRIYIINLEGISKQSILCFNMDGKFLFKVEKTGRGPEEYKGISDFDVSSDNNVLAILSSLNHKLLFYRISDSGFAFQRSVTLKDPYPYRISMVPETKNAFLAIPPWRGTEPTLSLLINSSGDTIHFKPNCYKYNNVRETSYMALNEMLVYSIGNATCFKEEFSDTVFFVDIKNNSFKPWVILNSHGTLSTPEIRGGAESDEKHSNYIANVFETSRYVFCYYFSSGPTRNRFLYDRVSSTKYKLDIETGLKDDLTGGPDFNIEFLNNYCSGGKLFSFVEAITLKKYVAGEDFKNVHVSDPEKKNEIKKLADSLNETDNPVLIVVTPRD